MLKHKELEKTKTGWTKLNWQMSFIIIRCYCSGCVHVLSVNLNVDRLPRDIISDVHAQAGGRRWPKTLIRRSTWKLFLCLKLCKSQKSWIKKDHYSQQRYLPDISQCRIRYKLVRALHIMKAVDDFVKVKMQNRQFTLLTVFHDCFKNIANICQALCLMCLFTV